MRREISIGRGLLLVAVDVGLWNAVDCVLGVEGRSK
jgi:hypothetical protein